MTPNSDCSSQNNPGHATETTGLLPPEAAPRTGTVTGTEATSGNDSSARALVEIDDTNANAIEQKDRKPFLYKLFMVISASAAVISGLMLLSQIASLVAVKGRFIPHVLRIVLAASCIMFLSAELEVRFFLERAPFFKSWFYRGILYTLVGGIAMEESRAALGQEYPEIPDGVALTLSVLLQVSSIAMFSFGLLYMLMGVFCLRGVWEDLQSKYNIETDRQEQVRHRPTATINV